MSRKRTQTSRTKTTETTDTEVKQEEVQQELAPAVSVDMTQEALNTRIPVKGVVCEADAPSPVTPGTTVMLRAKPDSPNYLYYSWKIDGGRLITSEEIVLQGDADDPNSYTDTRYSEVRWDTTGLSNGSHVAIVTVKDAKDDGVIIGTSSDIIQIAPPPLSQGSTVNVSLGRTEDDPTADQVLWSIIRNRTAAISFNSYTDYIDAVMCPAEEPPATIRDKVPFPFTDAYNRLKIGTEAFLMQECGTYIDTNYFNAQEESNRLGYAVTYDQLDQLRTAYLDELEGEHNTLPYFYLIRRKLSDLPLKNYYELGLNCYGILRSRLYQPLLIELLWNYWHEQSMLVQTMNLISLRFQNKSLTPTRDPLASLNLDPLRPLSNLLWGYVQDEQHRLSVVRRAYEYNQEYGLTLYGKAVPRLQASESRSQFLPAFHNLLYRAAVFYRQDDDTTKIADGFEVLNALREVHMQLAYGAHNQFGDLPATSRSEMLIQMWLLARPEMRDFLSSNTMVPYSEPWMDRVDAVRLQMDWGNLSVTYFHDLAVYGEDLVLSARYGDWSNVNDATQAANWARYWRPEVQRYIHSYRAVTGVDLSADTVESQRARDRYLQPSVYLRQRTELPQRTG